MQSNAKIPLLFVLNSVVEFIHEFCKSLYDMIQLANKNQTKIDRSLLLVSEPARNQIEQEPKFDTMLPTNYSSLSKL